MPPPQAPGSGRATPVALSMVVRLLHPCDAMTASIRDDEQLEHNRPGDGVVFLMQALGNDARRKCGIEADEGEGRKGRRCRRDKLRADAGRTPRRGRNDTSAQARTGRRPPSPVSARPVTGGDDDDDEIDGERRCSGHGAYSASTSPSNGPAARPAKLPAVAISVACALSSSSSASHAVPAPAASPLTKPVRMRPTYSHAVPLANRKTSAATAATRHGRQGDAAAGRSGRTAAGKMKPAEIADDVGGVDKRQRDCREAEGLAIEHIERVTSVLPMKVTAIMPATGQPALVPPLLFGCAT